jgi:two-component system, NtrC family, response regulator HydG
LLGESAAMQRVKVMIAKIAPTDANILILGENGTGKEVVARELHRYSLRGDATFVGVDMGAISETLFESELFGHVKGAFTDAKEDRAGRFEAASGGTLFLDEIGNLSLPLQAKLLAALQNRTITRVGSNKAVPVDIRLVCATNMPLYSMVEQKTFRQDLLYRMNTVEIALPPLRERPEDVPMLAAHFLFTYCEKYRKPLQSLSASGLRALQNYGWRGNVRELQHVLERAVIMNEKQTIDATDLHLAAVGGGSAGAGESSFGSSSGSSSGSNSGSGSELVSGLSVTHYNLEELEHLAIRKSLTKHNGNISHAAQELGLTRAALYRRMEKYGL